MTFLDVLEGRARWSIDRGEAYRLLLSMPDACVDAVITDPPYYHASASSWLEAEVRGLTPEDAARGQGSLFGGP